MIGSEGIHGMEFPPPCAQHEVTLPFTRLLAGLADTRPRTSARRAWATLPRRVWRPAYRLLTRATPKRRSEPRPPGRGWYGYFVTSGYSVRRAVIGWTEAAWRAGTNTATSAAPRSTSGTAAKVTASVGAIPYSRLASRSEEH